MPNKFDLSHELVKVPISETKLNVLQNVSDQPVQWTPKEDSQNFYFLRPGDFLKVNYDVWVKSDTHGVSHLVAGAFPDSYVPTYRPGVVKNRTYVQSIAAVDDATSTLSAMVEFSELTIQKNKNVKLTIRIPAISSGILSDGIVILTSIKINGVYRNFCDSDQILCHADRRVGQVYNKVLYFDLIKDGLVSNVDADYTFRVQLSAKSGSLGARISGGAGINHSGITALGTLLPSARIQNNLSIIVEELDR